MELYGLPIEESPEGVQQPEEVRIMLAENAETGKNPFLFCGIGEKLNPQHPERPLYLLWEIFP